MSSHWRPLTAPYTGCGWLVVGCGRGGVGAVPGRAGQGRALPPGAARRGVVGCPLQWGGVDGGYSPTIGVPLWWGAPYSGDRWIVGASPLLGLPDCGCARIVG